MNKKAITPLKRLLSRKINLLSHVSPRVHPKITNALYETKEIVKSKSILFASVNGVQRGQNLDLHLLTKPYQPKIHTKDRMIHNVCRILADNLVVSVSILTPASPLTR